jgi:uncharacterized protein YndB with AHSA1/START domain
MPTHKGFKRLVRTRMRKTGEAYTAARAQLLRRQSPTKPKSPDFAKLAGMSDESVRARTGRAWKEWVEVLDRAGAMEWPHSRIARHAREECQVPDWWCQAVAVGYERIKGLRAIGQRRDGTFEASKSRTLAVPLSRLYRAWSDPRQRAKWLPVTALKVRSAKREKYIRFTWTDETPVVVGFTKKSPAKCQVAVQHSKLASKEAAAAMKTYWAERLTALGEVLGVAAP